MQYFIPKMKWMHACLGVCVWCGLCVSVCV